MTNGQPIKSHWYIGFTVEGSLVLEWSFSPPYKIDILRRSGPCERRYLLTLENKS